jgi:hypothetical protein
MTDIVSGDKLQTSNSNLSKTVEKITIILYVIKCKLCTVIHNLKFYYLILTFSKKIPNMPQKNSVFMKTENWKCEWTLIEILAFLICLDNSLNSESSLGRIKMFLSCRLNAPDLVLHVYNVSIFEYISDLYF